MIPYRLLDIAFVVFHSGLILFNLLGWLWYRTRKLNLITLILTGLSWFGLGIWYGWGYCPSTDWHWQVRMKLGDYDLPRSYIKYLLHRLTGISLSDQLVDGLTLGGFLVALGISIYLNTRDRKRKKS